MPDVRGVAGGPSSAPASIRGLWGGSPDYWAKTKAQLRILGSEPAAEGRTTAASTVTWKACLTKHLTRPDLTPGDKYTFLALAQLADWKTGANCCPKASDLVARFGQTPRWWACRRQRLVQRGAIRLLGTRTKTGFGQALVQFLGDDGFASPATLGAKVRVRVQERAPRRTPPGRDPQGHWAAQ